MHVTSFDQLKAALNGNEPEVIVDHPEMVEKLQILLKLFLIFRALGVFFLGLGLFCLSKVDWAALQGFLERFSDPSFNNNLHSSIFLLVMCVIFWMTAYKLWNREKRVPGRHRHYRLEVIDSDILNRQIRFVMDKDSDKIIHN